MLPPIQLTESSTPKRKVIVASHERSGTHFLLNALEANLGYISVPWINLDYEVCLNFHAPKELEIALRHFTGKQLLNPIKTHHHFGFFQPFIENLVKEFQVLYICRDPRDVMLSMFRYLNAMEWDEGPRVGSATELMRMEPSGAMLRYQKRQHPNLVARWREHVEPWATCAARLPGVTLIRYEDLHQHFEATMHRLRDVLGEKTCGTSRPTPDRNVVVPGPGRVGGFEGIFTQEDEDFIRLHGGEIFRKLYPEG